MKTPDHPVTDIQIFAVMGAILLVAMVIAPLIGLSYYGQERARFNRCKAGSASETNCAPGRVWDFFGEVDREIKRGDDQAPATFTTTTVQGLGEEGSVCGGPERFPCKPGLECVRNTPEEMGLCLSATQD